MLVVPLLLLSYRLHRIKEKGLFEYGALGTQYVQAFDTKWNRPTTPEREPLLGTADLQSLADLSNSFAVVNDMSIVLFTRDTLLQLAIPAALPMLILLIAETPADELIHTVLKLMA